MTRTRHNEGLAVLQHGEQTQQGFITQAQVLDLPDVMQRYLSYAGVVDKESIYMVRLKQQGFMREHNLVRSGYRWSRNNISRRRLLHSSGTVRCDRFLSPGSRLPINSLGAMVV